MHRAGLPLLVAIVLNVLGSIAPSQVVRSSEYTYDLPTAAWADVQIVERTGRPSAQVSDSLSGVGTWVSNPPGSSTTPHHVVNATNFGAGGPDFNQAMNQALEWLLARGFKAEVPTIGKFGSTADCPIGMQIADGKIGFRVEFDARSGAHINV
jgi:hypothetical protein